VWWIETTIGEDNRLHTLYKELILFINKRMGIFHFPSNFVYWENIENHEKIKPIIMDKVLELDNGHYKNHIPGGIRNATSNFDVTTRNSFHEHFDNDIINQIVWKPLDNLLSNINSTPNHLPINLVNSVIGSSWYTKYEVGGMFKLHSHYGNPIFSNNFMYKPTFSIIYILNDENVHNSTQFTIPIGSPLSTLPRQEITYDTAYNKEIKEGSIIIFPSSLYHTVEPVKIPGRITIAFNICSRFVDDNMSVVN
jgi:hypothetical protein